MQKTIALIAACGSGIRLCLAENSANKTPKQYQKIAGISVLRHCVLAFLNNRKVDHVICVINPEHSKLYEESVLGLDLLNPVFGGETRQISVRNGLLALKSLNPHKVLIHDAARPLVSKAIINGVIEKLSDFSAVIPAVMVEDSLKKAIGSLVESNIDRENIWRAQTPQGFNYQEILAAHIDYQNLEFNDDSALARQAGIEVSIIPGSQNNFKITTFEDLERAKSLMFERTSLVPQFRIGNGFDVHAFAEFSSAESRKIRIGGVDIDSEKKVIAVSDGDVAIHALIDAILGALGEGDIGEHFPPSEKKWHGCDSRLMLTEIKLLIEKRQAKIVNLDLCVICEKPRILEYKKQIKEELARVLGIHETQINIKATTTEKLGFLGRSEGIACQASVLLLLS